MEVIDFDQPGPILQGFTNDVAALEKAIRQDDGQRLDVALQRDLHLAEGPEEGHAPPATIEIRRQAIVVLSDGDDTSSLVRLRRGARPGQALRNGDLRHRPAAEQTAAAATSRKRSSCSASCRRKPADARSSPPTSTELPKIYEQISQELAQPVRDRLLVEEPGAQRRLAPAVGARRTPEHDGPDPAGLLRARRHAVASAMHLIPLVLYGCAAGAYLAHFAWPRSQHRPAGDGAPRRRGARAHVPHRHADGAGGACAARRDDGGSVGVRLAARPGLPLRRADHRRTGDGRVRHDAAGGARTSFRRSIRRSRSRPAVLRSPLFTVHVLAMLFAYASFALACVLGVTYVLLFKEIKAKHLGFFYARLPSLQVLDVMNGRAVTIGWIFLTIGIAVGGIWATQVQGSSSDPRVQAMSPVGSEDPRRAGVAGRVYSFALFARRAIGWTGRRGRLAVGARLRDRAAQLRPGRVLPDEEPQLLMTRLFAVGLSHRTAPVELRESRGLLARRRRRRARRRSRPRHQPGDGGALDLQPRGDLRGRRTATRPDAVAPLLRRVSRAAAGAR